MKRLSVCVLLPIAIVLSVGICFYYGFRLGNPIVGAVYSVYPHGENPYKPEVEYIFVLSSQKKYCAVIPVDNDGVMIPSGEMKIEHHVWFQGPPPYYKLIRKLK